MCVGDGGEIPDGRGEEGQEHSDLWCCVCVGDGGEIPDGRGEEGQGEGREGGRRTSEEGAERQLEGTRSGRHDEWSVGDAQGG